MKMGLICYNMNDKKTRVAINMLLKSAKSKGHSMKLFDGDKFEMFYANGHNELFYAGKKFPDLDVVLCRLGHISDVDLKLTLNKHFLLMGIPILNGYMPYIRAKNKVRTLQILSHHGIRVPKTVVLRSLGYLDESIKRVGGFPVIIKTPAGSLGKGVAIVESRRSLFSSLDILWMDPTKRILIIQEYVEEAEGKDIRVFVIGGKVVASMERTAAEGDFRSNIGCGGEGQIMEITNEEKKMSIESAKLLGLDIAGVDILRTKSGPAIMEVNSNPGLEGITRVTGVDVAGKIIDFAVKKGSQKKVKMSARRLASDEPRSVI